MDVARSMPIRYCGSTILPNYVSLSGNVRLIFQTDESVVSTGYVAYETFVPCPVNAYVTGNWSEVCIQSLEFFNLFSEVDVQKLTAKSQSSLVPGLPEIQSEIRAL